MSQARDLSICGFHMLLGPIQPFLQVLTKAQKAYFECKSYPWSADWMQMCRILRQRKRKPMLVFPNLEHQGHDIDIFPKATAFQVSGQSLHLAKLPSLIKNTCTNQSHHPACHRCFSWTLRSKIKQCHSSSCGFFVSSRMSTFPCYCLSP